MKGRGRSREHRERDLGRGSLSRRSASWRATRATARKTRVVFRRPSATVCERGDADLSSPSPRGSKISDFRRQRSEQDRLPVVAGVNTTATSSRAKRRDGGREPEGSDEAFPVTTPNLNTTLEVALESLASKRRFSSPGRDRRRRKSLYRRGSDGSRRFHAESERFVSLSVPTSFNERFDVDD